MSKEPLDWDSILSFIIGFFIVLVLLVIVAVAVRLEGWPGE